MILRANEWGEDPAAWMAGKADNIETVQEPISMEALVAKQPDLVYGEDSNLMDYPQMQYSKRKSLLSLTPQSATTSILTRKKTSRLMRF